MLIRPVDPATELDALNELRFALWPDAASDPIEEAALREWFARPDAITLVAVERAEDGRERPIGFAEVGERSHADSCETHPVAYLEGWYVVPDRRGQGVGRALVEAVEAWARERGLRELASDTELENTGSQRAHGRLGFAEVGRVVQFRKLL